MINALGVIVGVVLGVALLGAMGAGSYLGFQWVMDHWAPEYFGILEPQVATFLAIVSVVVVLCATILSGGLKSLRRRDAEMQLRAEKADVYEKLLLCWGEVLSTRTTTVEPSLLNDLRKLERVLTLRGSARVIKLYSDIQACANGSRPQSADLPSQLVKLTLEMRRDLGQSTISIGEQELLTVLNLVPPKERTPAPAQTPLSPVSLGQGG